MNVITVYGNKMNIQLDMYQTLAIAVVVLILGQFLKNNRKERNSGQSNDISVPGEKWNI